MPDRNVIYRKSAKGAEAIASRDHSLTPKQRSLLILVDGKRGTEDLAKLSAALGDPAQILAQLLEQGHIEAVHGVVAAPVQGAAPPAAGPAAAGPPHPPFQLRDAQRFAVRRLTDILGPTGEMLCMRIEGAHNEHEFAQAIQRAVMVLRDFGGEDLAQGFAREMQARGLRTRDPT